MQQIFQKTSIEMNIVPLQYLNHQHAPLLSNQSLVAVDRSLSQFGISDEQKKKLFQYIAAILHLENIDFIEVGNDSCEIIDSSRSSLQAAANLMRTNVKEKWQYAPTVWKMSSGKDFLNSRTSRNMFNLNTNQTVLISSHFGILSYNT